MLPPPTLTLSPLPADSVLQMTTFPHDSQMGGFYTHPYTAVGRTVHPLNSVFEHRFSVDVAGLYEIRAIGISNADHAVIAWFVDGEKISLDGDQVCVVCVVLCPSTHSHLSCPHTTSLLHRTALTVSVRCVLYAVPQTHTQTHT